MISHQQNRNIPWNFILGSINCVLKCFWLGVSVFSSGPEWATVHTGFAVVPDNVFLFHSQIVFIHSVCADNGQYTTIQKLFCVVFSFAIDTNIKNYAHLHEYCEFIPFILWTTFSSLIKFGKWKPLQTVRIIKIGNEHDTGNAKQFSNLVYYDPATNNAINVSDGSRLTQCQSNISYTYILLL